MIGEITGESIKSAISLKLKSSFANTNGSPPITIYKEQIVQGFKKPSFFIWIMDVSQEKLLGNKYERLYQMNIRYHPEEKDLKTYETLAEIGNQILEVLTYIEVPINLGRKDTLGNPIEDKKPVMGKQMSFKIIDDVLQVYVNYVIRGKFKELEKPHMQSLEINEK